MAGQNSKKFLKLSILAIFFLIIFGYAFFGARELIFGVNIRDVNMEKSEGASGGVLNISGNAKNAQALILNGRPISIDERGNFRETIAMPSGYNTISIQAKDKFGNEDEKFYQLIHSPTAE